MSRRPLEGRTVIVTRSRAQAAELVDGLSALGADVLTFPTIRTIAPESWEEADRAAARLDTYDWVVFTSANAVRAFLERLDSLGVDPAALKTAGLAAVGPSTAARLIARGLEPDLVPDNHVAEGLLEAMLARGVGEGSRVLLPRALEAREVLPETLRERGAVVDVVPVYRTVLGEGDPRVLALLCSGAIDAITFTSSSTAVNFSELAGEAARDAVRAGALVASIGPVTSGTLRSLGFGVDVEAEPSTVGGLVLAIAEHYASPGA